MNSHYRSPQHPEVLSIKRIIALEGDTVYTRAPYPYPTAVVPLNHVWVEGDNRDGRKTLDSNYYGPIAKPLIVGKVTHVLWPWNSSGPIPWWDYKGRTRVIKGRLDDAPRFDWESFGSRQYYLPFHMESMSHSKKANSKLWATKGHMSWDLRYLRNITQRGAMPAEDWWRCLRPYHIVFSRSASARDY